MKIRSISIHSDNACLFDDSLPTMVVISVMLDDGKNVQFPYDAKKSFRSLHGDIEKIVAKLNKSATPRLEQDVPVDDFNMPDDKTGCETRPTVAIEREDIVECVESMERDGVEADMIPVIGKEYRVIDIIRKGQNVALYEVLDDSSLTKIRIPVFPVEMKLKRKHIPGPARKLSYSVIKKCSCGEDNSLDLKGDVYKGKCEKCGQELMQERILPKG